MRHPKIPDGWEFWTSEPSSDDAWHLAVEMKQRYEGVRADVLVRVKVVPAAGGYWVLYRIETKERAA